MPREARKTSQSETYHIMLRGINQQQIFEDEEDYQKFVEVLKNYQAICGYTIYAYCLMGNHIHLLMRFNNETIGQAFKRIGSKYVYWYNIKYQRKGHLFQDRFKSEPVEDDSYFLTVIRYIHQNPVKAGLCKKLEDYRYSSYNEYLEEPQIVDIEQAFSLMKKESFIEYNNEPSSDICIDVEESNIKRVTDEEAHKIIKKYSKCDSVSEFQALPIAKRNKFLKLFKEKGISIRQISRLTGVSYYIVQKI